MAFDGTADMGNVATDVSGTIVIGAVLPGLRSISDLAAGTEIEYIIIHQDNLSFEIGRGTFDGTNLQRDYIHTSSNAGAAISEPVGTLVVYNRAHKEPISPYALRFHKHSGIYANGLSLDAVTISASQQAEAGKIYINTGASSVVLTAPTNPFIGDWFQMANNGTSTFSFSGNILQAKTQAVLQPGAFIELIYYESYWIMKASTGSVSVS